MSSRIKKVEERCYTTRFSARIRRIFSNIFDNSIFALRDSPSPQIRVSFADPKGNLSIRNSDNGEGIPNTILSFLGKERVTTKSPSKGSGIALQHAKRVIERINGEFEVFLNENCQTQVSLRLKILK